MGVVYRRLGREVKEYHLLLFVLTLVFFPPVLAGGRGSVGVECVRVYPILNAKDVLVGVVLKKGN